MTELVRRVTPAAVAGVTVVLSGTAVALAVLDHQDAGVLLAQNEANTWLAGLGFGIVGAAVLRDAPGNRLGPLLAAGGLLAAVSALGNAVAQDPGRPLAAAAAWAASVLWFPALLGLTLLVPLLYPDGRLASPRWRWPARVGCAAAAFACLALATTQDALDSSGFRFARNPVDLPLPDGPQLAVAAVGFAVAVFTGLAAAVGVLVRMRRVPRFERARNAWFAAAILLGLLTLLPLPPAADFGLNVLSFAALGVGITRHRLFDIEPVLSRTLVYLVLSGAAVTVYLGTAAVLGAGTRAGVVPALLTAVAALLLARLQTRLHAGVTRLLYGERDDPVAALQRLGDRLAATLSTEDVLPASVQAVRRTLRLPYAAIRLAGEERPACVAGDAPARTVDLPLQHAGEDAGVLTVGLRSGERELADRDAELLTRFAQQVAVAAHGVRATRELVRSREQVVSTREQERARIHRDLHDGLGPALAGISLGLETAGRTAARDGRAAARLLEDLRAETAACVDDVRRIVADLRPPALTEAGLVGALRRQGELLAARTGGALTVRVEADALDDLPAAVEVAAYRIASEAMTNVARHARATRMRVGLHRDDGLHVTVEDDGTGTPPAGTGTGLVSMRHRAEELGGTCTVRFRRGQGTRVHAVLPLAPAAPVDGVDGVDGVVGS